MKVSIFLFDYFDGLEAFGPAEVFGRLPESFHLEYYSLRGSFVTSVQGIQVWTDVLTKELRSDILLVPGGKGARRLLRTEEKSFGLLKKAAEQTSCCMMIGSGASLLAQTGVLFRRSICDYPMDENWNRMFTAGVYRQPETRWVADGKFYSAVNSIDGIDMSLNVLADTLDLSAAERVASELGYRWDPEEEDGIYR